MLCLPFLLFSALSLSLSFFFASMMCLLLSLVLCAVVAGGQQTTPFVGVASNGSLLITSAPNQPVMVNGVDVLASIRDLQKALSALQTTPAPGVAFWNMTRWLVTEGSGLACDAPTRQDSSPAMSSRITYTNNVNSGDSWIVRLAGIYSITLMYNNDGSALFQLRVNGVEVFRHAHVVTGQGTYFEGAMTWTGFVPVNATVRFQLYVNQGIMLATSPSSVSFTLIAPA